MWLLVLFQEDQSGILLFEHDHRKLDDQFGQSGIATRSEAEKDKGVGFGARGKA